MNDLESIPRVEKLTHADNSAWIISEMEGVEVHACLGTVSDVKFTIKKVENIQAKKDREERTDHAV